MGKLSYQPTYWAALLRLLLLLLLLFSCSVVVGGGGTLCCCFYYFCCCGSIGHYSHFSPFSSYLTCFFPVTLTGPTRCKWAKPVWWWDDRNKVASDQKYQNQMSLYIRVEFVIQNNAAARCFVDLQEKVIIINLYSLFIGLRYQRPSSYWVNLLEHETALKVQSERVMRPVVIGRTNASSFRTGGRNYLRRRPLIRWNHASSFAK